MVTFIYYNSSYSSSHQQTVSVLCHCFTFICVVRNDMQLLISTATCLIIFCHCCTFICVVRRQYATPHFKSNLSDFLMPLLHLCISGQETICNSSSQQQSVGLFQQLLQFCLCGQETMCNSSCQQQSFR